MYNNPQLYEGVQRSIQYLDCNKNKERGASYFLILQISLNFGDER